MVKAPPKLKVEFHPNGFLMTLTDEDSGMKYVYSLDIMFDASTARFLNKDPSYFKEPAKPKIKRTKNIIPFNRKK